MTHLINDVGLPFTINGLGNKMRHWRDPAGLHQCTARPAKGGCGDPGGEWCDGARALRDLRMVKARNCRDLHPPGSPADDGGEGIHAVLKNIETRKVSQFLDRKRPMRQNGKIIVINQTPNSYMVGPAGMALTSIFNSLNCQTVLSVAVGAK
jgi:hypothetical protein